MQCQLDETGVKIVLWLLIHILIYQCINQPVSQLLKSWNNIALFVFPLVIQSRRRLWVNHCGNRTQTETHCKASNKNPIVCARACQLCNPFDAVIRTEQLSMACYRYRTAARRLAELRCCGVCGEVFPSAKKAREYKLKKHAYS